MSSRPAWTTQRDHVSHTQIEEAEQAPGPEPDFHMSSMLESSYHKFEITVFYDKGTNDRSI
jgi:hypothetical protein